MAGHAWQGGSRSVPPKVGARAGRGRPRSTAREAAPRCLPAAPRGASAAATRTHRKAWAAPWVPEPYGWCVPCSSLHAPQSIGRPAPPANTLACCGCTSTAQGRRGRLQQPWVHPSGRNAPGHGAGPTPGAPRAASRYRCRRRNAPGRGTGPPPGRGRVPARGAAQRSEALAAASSTAARRSPPGCAGARPRVGQPSGRACSGIVDGGGAAGRQPPAAGCTRGMPGWKTGWGERAAAAPGQPRWRRRGSSASRRASPRKLNASTARKIVAPGPALIHHLKFAR